MVTNSQEYAEKLWQLQSTYPTTKAVLLPGDETIYEVDLDTRTIAVPKFLSVAKDHQAETIYFKFDRYYDRIDLTTKCCIIQYTNAAGKSYIYPVPYYDTETLEPMNQVIIPWCIQGAATEKAGTVKFAICFYSVDINHHISYALNTLVASGEILNGQNASDFSDYEESQITLDSDLLLTLQSLQALATSHELAVYWMDV